MKSEIEALEANKTWSLARLPPGKRALGSKWLYKLKYRSDGTLERYKARLVVLGNNQREGVDYGETFAPVAKMDTVRMFLANAAICNYELHQMDVHNAFLHCDFDDEVFMRLPQGFECSDPTLVCRLHKSLYVLKLAPRCWFAKLSKALKEFGFTQSRSDYSLFTYNKNGHVLQVLVYVDDLVITGNSPSEIQSFKGYLSTCFHMKDLGILKYFLGIEVARNKSGIYLSQRKYTLDIISDAGLLGAKLTLLPLEQNHTLPRSESPLLTDSTSYRRIVGRLIYLAVTRPDLSYSVHTLAQFMKAPRLDHWNAALKTVCYLKSNPGQGILLRSDSALQITDWCDSNWASCPITRCSTTGYFIQLGCSPIAWKTRKQPIVSRSSAEAEYRAMAVLTQELLWLKRVLRDLGHVHTAPMGVYSDSKSAIQLAANPVQHERTKHIEVDIHFIRDEIINSTIVTHYVHTKDQLADIFTKSLGRKEFVRFFSKLGAYDLHAPT